METEEADNRTSNFSNNYNIIPIFLFLDIQEVKKQYRVVNVGVLILSHILVTLTKISGIKKKRPIGVTVVAIFLFISTALGLLSYPIIFIYPSYYSSKAIGTITITASTVITLYIVAAVGLLKLREWARKLTIVSIWIAFITGLIEAYVTVVDLMYKVTNYIPETTPTSAIALRIVYFSASVGIAISISIGIIFPILFTWYLRKSDVKMAFKLE